MLGCASGVGEDEESNWGSSAVANVAAVVIWLLSFGLGWETGVEGGGLTAGSHGSCSDGIAGTREKNGKIELGL